MKPIYRFKLKSASGITNPAFPLYKDDLTLDYELQQNERFYRAKLGGKIIFAGADYTRIMNDDFVNKFTLIIEVSNNNGQMFTECYRGDFYKTDCKFDLDAQTIEVTPTPVDDYVEVLAGMEKEFNLIDLKPEIEKVTMFKRPLVQLYVPGESVVSCFLSNMSWEQDCDVVTNENDLSGKYFFTQIDQRQIVSVSGSQDVPRIFMGDIPDTLTTPFSFESGGFVFRMYSVRTSVSTRYYWEIVRNDVIMWRDDSTIAPSAVPYEVRLQPMTSTHREVIYVRIYQQRIYSRFLLDTETFLGQSTHALLPEDMCGNNRNYRRATGFSESGLIYYSSNTSSEPTEYGIRQPGEYWTRPETGQAGLTLYPVGRSHWLDMSIWFAGSPYSGIYEDEGTKAYTLQDAYPLSSVISVILQKIAPGITHEATMEYSRFLYADINPISYQSFRLMLTPKSNVLAGDYTQPAQKAPITLKTITDMLKSCFRAYWYIEDGKFKIEHIKYFRNGGSYVGSPDISHDLTTEVAIRNGKPWSFGTKQYEFSKVTMPERYQFGWMDDATKMFDGYPIEVVSPFVNRGNIEEITVNNFSSDVDYMLLNPSAFSQDGYALLGTKTVSMLSNVFGSRIITIQASGDWYNWIIGEPVIGTKTGFRVEVLTGSLHVVYSGNGAARAIGDYGVGVHDVYIDINILGGILIMQNTTGYTNTRFTILNRYGNNALPIVNTIIDGVEYITQNGYVSFAYLAPNFYLYDLPSYDVIINNRNYVALGITREKKQTIKFPMLNAPDVRKLIKTDIGDGQIEKISVNLSSRNANATLMFDTYTDE